MKKMLILLLIGVALFSSIALSHYRQARQTLDVNTTLVSEGGIVESILASGNLEFNTQIQIRSEVTGRIQEVLVNEGDTVEKGQLLMRLERTAFEAEVSRTRAVVRSQQIDIQRAKAQLADLERQFARHEQLYHSALLQRETIDSLKSQLDIANINVAAAEAALEQGKASMSIAEDNLSKTLFRAPMAGLLATVDVKPGETVIAGSTNIVGSPLMTLADPSTILAELRVDEADIANVYIGQSTEIFAAAYPHQPISGEVIQIATSARYLNQSESLSFRVKVLLQPKNNVLYPGMSCRAEIIISEQDSGLHVPIAAVQHEGDAAFVWTVEDGKAHKRPVALGLVNDIAQEISTGLAGDEEVIIGPARTLLNIKHGSRISVNLREY